MARRKPATGKRESSASDWDDWDGEDMGAEDRWASVDEETLWNPSETKPGRLPSWRAIEIASEQKALRCELEDFPAL